MATINQYLNNGSNTPNLSNSPVDASTLLGIGNSVGQAYQQNLGQNLQMANQASLEAKRANMLLAETQHQHDLGLKEDYIKTNQIILQGINNIAAIDESKRKQEESRMNSVYQLNSLSKLNTDYIQYIDQVKQNMSGDWSGYSGAIQGFLDDQIKSMVNNAPNEEAKFDIYTKASEFKLRALNNALEVESKARDAYKTNLIIDSADQIVNQAALNPTNADNYLSDLNKVATVMSENGFNEAQIQGFLKDKTTSLREAQIRSLLNTGNSNSAEEIINGEQLQKELEPKKFLNLKQEVIEYKIAESKRLQEQGNIALAGEQFLQGMLPKGDKNFNKVADVVADNLLFSQIPESPNFSVNDIPQAAGSIRSFFQKYNSGIGAQTANKLESKVLTSNNIFEVAAYSMGIDSLVRDPNSQSFEVLKGLSDDTKVLAGRIAQLTNGGIPAQEAVRTAREELKQSKTNAGLNTYVNQNLSEQALSDANISSWLEKALDTSGTWFPSDSAARYMGYVKDAYKGNLYRYGNPDLAQQATIAQIKNTLAVTTVNGDNQIMEAAPEMFYSGNSYLGIMSVFKDQLAKSKKSLATEFGWADNGDGTYNTSNGRVKPEIRPIIDVTLSQPLYNKTYELVDGNTGLPIQHPKTGQYARFNFKLDDTEYGKALIAENERKRKIQENYNNLWDKKINTYERDWFTVKTTALAQAGQDAIVGLFTGDKE